MQPDLRELLSNRARPPLAYITTAEVTAYLDEIAADGLEQEIGFTGGEPFLEMIDILEATLSRSFRALVLTNAMRPLAKMRTGCCGCANHTAMSGYTRFCRPLRTNTPRKERGPRSWEPAIAGLTWLSENGQINVAGRTFWDEDEASLRAGYGRLFSKIGLAIDPQNPVDLVLFPEMDEMADVPEITTACWGILDVSPDAMMCASSRMVLKRRGTDKTIVVPCTLLPYDERFEMGETLAEAAADVALNHPHCAKFCVLGGGACGIPALAPFLPPRRS